MKKISLLAVCLFALSCGGYQGEVTFKIAQPLGQKSVYAITNNLNMEIESPQLPGGSQKAVALLKATLETEVTANQPDGRWTLESRFGSVEMQVDGQTINDAKSLLENRTFSISMGKDGKVLDVSGVENLMPGMDLKQMMGQMNPAMMLPGKPVKVGESWPIEISSPLQVQGAIFQQKLTGTGTLKDVDDGQALIEITYKMEMSLIEAGDEGMNMTGTGTGKSSLAYDLETARFTSNKTETTIESIGREAGANRPPTSRSVIKSSMEVSLVNK